MTTDTIINDLEREKLPETAAELVKDGYRLVQMMGTPRKDDIEVMVSFDKGWELKNFRIQVPRNDLTLPSITGSTLAAFSYENEMQDLFGIKVSDLAIDYGGNFLRTKKIHPLADMFDPAAEKKAAAAKKAAAKKAAAGEGEKKTKDGQTIKTVPVSGVNCETAPDIDNPKPENE